MANGANFVVLDEPTNHLDLPAIEQLEQALDTFPGTVLLVTHDRSLLERARLTRTIELAGGVIVADEFHTPDPRCDERTDRPSVRSLIARGAERRTSHAGHDPKIRPF